MKTFLVAPTIRSLDFMKSWGDQFRSCHIVVVEDNPFPTIKHEKALCKSITYYSWRNISDDFGKDEWIFSRRNAGIRSYGFWKAYKEGADVIITIDDDCFPAEDDFVARHVANLNMKLAESWVPTYIHPDFLYTRGFPYDILNKYKTRISHGLWSHTIDLDGITEQTHPGVVHRTYPPVCTIIPRGYYFPMCSMNLAFTREITPLMYFPLMGQDVNGRLWGYDRFDDIWAGVFAKKICDHLGYGVVSGSPFVKHLRASSTKDNIRKERRGIITHEQIWRAVDAVRLTETTPEACYLELAERVQFPDEEYFKALRTAMKIWASLFK